jgi:hypothetical protein
LLDGQLEGQPGAQGGFLEEQAQIAAFERARVRGGRALERGREIEQLDQFFLGKVQIPGETPDGGFGKGIRREGGRGCMNIHHNE